MYDILPGTKLLKFLKVWPTAAALLKKQTITFASTLRDQKPTVFQSLQQCKWNFLFVIWNKLNGKKPASFFLNSAIVFSALIFCGAWQ